MVLYTIIFFFQKFKEKIVFLYNKRKYDFYINNYNILYIIKITFILHLICKIKIRNTTLSRKLELYLKL